MFGEERLSYEQLNARARRLANALAAAGVEPGHRVAAPVRNCPEFIEAFFATAKLGAIFVPIDFRLVAREVAQILGQCRRAVLLAGESMRVVCDALQRLTKGDDPDGGPDHSGGRRTAASWQRGSVHRRNAPDPPRNLSAGFSV